MKRLVFDEYFSVIPIAEFASELSQTIFEEDLVIEAWMHDGHLWISSTETFFQVEKERVLQIESWMTNDENWEPKKSTSSKVTIVETNNGSVCVFKMKKDKEQPLRIEKWMVDDKYWNM